MASHRPVPFVNSSNTMLRNTSPGVGQASTSSASRQAVCEEFYPLNYVRGDWLAHITSIGGGKKRCRHLLSDEVLCLGSDNVPIASEFRHGLIFHEAFFPGQSAPDAQLYLTLAQAEFLVDEVYAKAGIGNPLPFEAFDMDRTKIVQKHTFAGIRRVAFKNDIGSFRSRGKLPVSTKQANAAVPPGVTENNGKGKEAAHPAVPSGLSAEKDAPTSQINSGAVPGRARQGYNPSSLRIDKQLAKAHLRDQELEVHIAAQKRYFPLAQKVYRNLKKKGGAALAVDVESWTEDADVLLEVGAAWFTWTDGAEKQGGSRHWIIEETTAYRNVEIEATREDYELGDSLTLPQAKVAQQLRDLIKSLSADFLLIMIFHDASAETKYFTRLGLSTAGYLKMIPPDLSSEPPLFWPDSSSPVRDILLQDTQKLFCGWSQPPVKQINLGKACVALGMEEAQKLHNAGNDAYWTLKVWETLLEKDGEQDEGGEDRPGTVQ